MLLIISLEHQSQEHTKPNKSVEVLHFNKEKSDWNTILTRIPREIETRRRETMFPKSSGKIDTSIHRNQLILAATSVKLSTAASILVLRSLKSYWEIGSVLTLTSSLMLILNSSIYKFSTLRILNSNVISWMASHFSLSTTTSTWTSWWTMLRHVNMTTSGMYQSNAFIDEIWPSLKANVLFYMTYLVFNSKHPKKLHDICEIPNIIT